MKNGFFRGLANKISGSLLLLKRKVNHELFRKNAMLFRGRMMEAKSFLRGMISGLKSYLLAAIAMLRLMTTSEALASYKRWCREHLNRQALKGYACAAGRFLRDLPSKLTWANICLWSKMFWNWIRNLGINLRQIRKNAVLASVALLLLCIFMGSTLSMAWLTHTTPTERNTFTVGKMELTVKYQNDNTDGYLPMDKESVVFNEEALYEPGYTQVVFFQVINDGNVAFDYQIEVAPAGFEDSVNVYGEPLHLPKYLKFGIITAKTKPELDRKLAQVYADMDLLEVYPLGHRSDIRYNIGENEMEHAALIIYMPEYVGNEANYRKGENPPKVYLGVNVYAQQAGTMGKELP